ncbi:hypothetical protein E5D57_002651 [Metarhizium anisopliae]|nr:hypothetical protein E5D57_002651 [Metarhizium anisopliae]
MHLNRSDIPHDPRHQGHQTLRACPAPIHTLFSRRTHGTNKLRVLSTLPMEAAAAPQASMSEARTRNDTADTVT